MNTYRRLTYADRCQISAYLSINLSTSEIARRLGFNKSSISREVRRNRAEAGQYDPVVAQEQYKKRFMRCRRSVLIAGKLQDLIHEKIEQRWSPEQISGRFKREGTAQISHTTIYRYIHKAPKELGLKKFLRRSRPKKMSRRSYMSYRDSSQLNIRSRCSGANNRTRFGHWERDTMYVAQRKMLIVCTERKSRYLKIDKVREPMSLFLTNQTKEMIAETNRPCLSITNDNGGEFRDGELFECPVYYCDPRKPQQRGTVENTIGLLRQYVPRKSLVQDIDVKSIESALNHRPRKCLDYRTPHEVMYGENVALVV